MSTFLGELGKKLAEKWLSFLVVPGLLYVGLLFAAQALGNGHAFDLDRLSRRTTSLTTGLGGHANVQAVLVAAGVLLMSSAAGLLAQALSAIVLRVWLGGWGPLGRPLRSRRKRHWIEANRAWQKAPDGTSQSALDALAATRNRICLAPPRRPTWIGDRVAALDTRVHLEYGLDLAFAWPALWLVVPDTVRAELRSARDRLDSAATVTAWGVLTALVTLLWWPATLIAGALLLAGWHRGRAATDTYAALAETTVDLHGTALADSLGIPRPSGQRLTPSVGTQITKALRKGA